MASHMADTPSVSGEQGPLVFALAEADGAEADRELLRRVANREPGALDDFYQRYRARALSVALRITGDPELAEDAVQEAFLQAWRNAAHYSSSTATVKSWLLGIVHHRAVDTMRTRRPTSELPTGEEMPEVLTLPDIWPEVSRRLDRDLVRRALEALTTPQREAIELAYFGGLSQREIAIRTDTPLGTVKSRVRDALIVLRHAVRGDLGLLGPQSAG